MGIRKKISLALGWSMFFSFFFMGVSGAYAEESADYLPGNDPAPRGDYTSLFTGKDSGTGILKNTLFSGVKSDVRVLARDIIFVVLGFLGTLMIVIMLYGGFLWMTASGDEEKIKKAQHHVRDAIIGVVLVMSAWTISIFVLESLKYTVKEGGELDTLESQLAPSTYSVDDICYSACSGVEGTNCISTCRSVCAGAKYLNECECHEKRELGGIVQTEFGCSSNIKVDK